MRKHALTFATILAVLCGGSSALASGRDVIQDCTDDEVLSKTYKQKEYRDALAKLPADADQYGNCRDVIGRAQEQAAKKGGSSSTKKDTGTGSVGAAPADGGTPGGHDPATQSPSSKPASEQLAAATPDDRAAAEAAANDDALPEVSAGNVGTAPGDDSSANLPAPILVLLALLFASGLALLVVRVRSLVDSRRA